MIYDGQPDFEQRLLPALRARRFFRLATTVEIDAGFAAYQRGRPANLVNVWQAEARPVRARLDGIAGYLQERSAWLPPRLLGLAFLSTTRAVLEAGRRLRAQLRPEVAAVLGAEFPWLEERHQHIPPGAVPRMDFPPEFGHFLESGSLDDARARWQLTTALNEVQQSHCSRHLARLFRLEELARHADRERELAENYLAHWSPPATRALFAQCIYILDALNAAVFAAVWGPAGYGIRARALWGTLTGSREWPAFCAALALPQRLLPPPAPSALRRQPQTE